MDNMSINEFIELILKDKSNLQQKYTLGVLTEAEIELIKEKTGIDVSGYTRIIENYGVLHALKHHGNKKEEELRGQIAITPEDFEKIPEITKNPDAVNNVGKSKRGGIVIQFIKRIENLFFYDEEIRINKKELATKSLYKRK
jgi:hypothetical protein